MTPQDYLAQNKDRFLDELFDLLRIPSISADPAYAGDVMRCAESVADHLRKAGADNVEVMPTPGYPVVYGERIVDPSLPTVLVYGHYDVQPPDPLDLWTSPAFEPVIRKTELHPEGAIFARGACDVDRYNRFFHAMLDRGVYLAPSAFEAGFVSGAHSDEAIAATLAAAAEAFAEIAA